MMTWIYGEIFSSFCLEMRSWQESVAGAADVEGTLCYGIDYFLFLVK